MDTIQLNNGVKMPTKGYGVYQVSPDGCAQHVREAIEVGYRLIDTAQAYQNEKQVGEGIATCGLDRSSLFVVSKIWPSNYGYAKAKASIEKSISNLHGDYIDLMLLHWPWKDFHEAWLALEAAYKEGKVRAIGVSNFSASQIDELIKHGSVMPAVNQVETHVFFQQQAIHEYLKEKSIHHMAWSPFAEGKNNFFANATLTTIGKAHGKSPAQVALRFLLQRGITAIPKTIHQDRMRENYAIEDFELSPEEMEDIRRLDLNRGVVNG